MRPGSNASKAAKPSNIGNGPLIIREDFSGLILTIQEGHAALASSEQELLDRDPNGFANDSQLHAIAELSRRLGTGTGRVISQRQTRQPGPAIV